MGNAWQTQYNDRRPFVIPNSVVQTGTDADGHPIYAENTTPIDMNKMNAYWYHTNNKPHNYEVTVLPKDFLKLRDVTVSYRLPAAVADKISAQSITLSVVARNFLIWVPKENTFIDPEISNLGNDLIGEFGEMAGAPTQKAFGAAIKINF